MAVSMSMRLVGTGVGGDCDGIAASWYETSDEWVSRARLQHPMGLIATAGQRLLVADTRNNAIRMVELQTNEDARDEEGKTLTPREAETMVFSDNPGLDAGHIEPLPRAIPRVLAGPVDDGIARQGRALHQDLEASSSPSESDPQVLRSEIRVLGNSTRALVQSSAGVSSSAAGDAAAPSLLRGTRRYVRTLELSETVDEPSAMALDGITGDLYVQCGGLERRGPRGVVKRITPSGRVSEYHRGYYNGLAWDPGCKRTRRSAALIVASASQRNVARIVPDTVNEFGPGGWRVLAHGDMKNGGCKSPDWRSPLGVSVFVSDTSNDPSSFRPMPAASTVLPAHSYESCNYARQIEGVIVSDSDAHMIRLIRLDALGLTFNLAGTGCIGDEDGVAARATFEQPSAVAVDGGRIYVVDGLYCDRIRVITPDPVFSVHTSQEDNMLWCASGSVVSTIAALGVSTCGHGLAILDACSFAVPVPYDHSVYVVGAPAEKICAALLEASPVFANMPPGVLPVILKYACWL